MRIGPEDFIRVVQVFDHRFPFFISMAFDDRFFLFFSLQVHAHTNGIGFRMELCADHVIRKTDGHDGPFKRYMRPFFFNTKYPSTHFPQPVMIRLDDLVVPAVHTIKRIV